MTLTWNHGACLMFLCLVNACPVVASIECIAAGGNFLLFIANLAGTGIE